MLGLGAELRCASRMSKRLQLQSCATSLHVVSIAGARQPGNKQRRSTLHAWLLSGQSRLSDDCQRVTTTHPQRPDSTVMVGGNAVVRPLVVRRRGSSTVPFVWRVDVDGWMEDVGGGAAPKRTYSTCDATAHQTHTQPPLPVTHGITYTGATWGTVGKVVCTNTPVRSFTCIVHITPHMRGNERTHYE